ncbi:MAG: PorP/SprF family type IX secretion system membrane protein [Opitutaceae bacterium]|nr:PorP/SprF family type IX secretion system membrane protein [Cytophagales bacterium]
MKLFVLIVLSFLTHIASLGQFVVNYSQFQLNKALYNPAAAGINNTVNTTLFNRREWTSFPGTPQSNVLIGDMPINYERMGIGIRIGQQSIVANNNWEGHILYSYKINMGKGRLAFGMNVGLQQYQFNSSKLAILDDDDILLSSKQNALYPDLGCGLFYVKNRFSLGLSALGLLKHPNNSFNIENTKSYNSKNITLITSKIWILGSSLELESALLANYMLNYNPFVSCSFVANYKKELYVGGNFKSNKSAAVILGIKLDKLSASLENVCLGYSYDLNFSALNKYLNNTHEITLNLNFDKPKSVKKAKQKPEEISPYNL